MYFSLENIGHSSQQWSLEGEVGRNIFKISKNHKNNKNFKKVPLTISNSPEFTENQNIGEKIKKYKFPGIIA